MARSFNVALVAAVSTFAFAAPASASIVLDDSIHLTAQGFGNAPRILTVQGNGTESGCVAVGSGGTLVGGAGACISSASVHDSNGVTNTGGSEVSPLSDNQKFGVPTIASLGWHSASDIGLLFNATEPGGDSININDITLKFYNGSSLVAAIDGQQALASTDPGNGVAGFTFVVDPTEQTFLNNAIFSQPGFGNLQIALESTLSDAAGGPESWLAFNLGGGVPTTFGSVPEPATWGVMILGLGMISGMMRRRQRQSGRLNFAEGITHSPTS
jgi:hypothetical protein